MEWLDTRYAPSGDGEVRAVPQTGGREAIGEKMRMTFRERGVAPLKGVPSDWRLYAVEGP